MIDATHIALAKQQHWVLPSCIQRVDIDTRVLASVPILLKHLSELVSTSPTHAFQSILAHLISSKMSCFDAFNLLFLDFVLSKFACHRVETT